MSMTPFPSLNRRLKACLFLVLAGAGLSLILDAPLKQAAGIVLVGLAATSLVVGLSVRTLQFLVSLLLLVAGLSIAVVPVCTDWSSYRTSLKDYGRAIADLRQAVKQADGALTLPADFFDRQPVDQDTYLSRADSDFAKASLVDQRAYVEYLTKRAKSSTRTVEIPESTRRWFIEAGRAPAPPPPGFTLDAAAVATPVTGEDVPPPPPGFTIPAPPTGFTLVSIQFPNNMSDEDIMRAMQTQTFTKPSFSILASVKSHRITSIGGVAIAVCGFLGFAWIIWIRGRMASGPHNICSLPTKAI
jgi:hypothetical protein